MMLDGLTLFLLTPLREGRRGSGRTGTDAGNYFYSRPCGRGDDPGPARRPPAAYFYSRPCGRGDPARRCAAAACGQFLLTPLREGRRMAFDDDTVAVDISTHAPAGGATIMHMMADTTYIFLLTPLREGRPARSSRRVFCTVFLLTPLREGRPTTPARCSLTSIFLLTPLREGRPVLHGRGPYPDVFLLTPLREGRLGGIAMPRIDELFLLTPLREGRPRDRYAQP